MKKGKIIKDILYAIIMICCTYNIIFVLYTTISQNEYLELFGISFFNMKTDLMSEDIEKNSLVIVKKVKGQNLKKGDIIAYQINGKVRINKIVNDQKGYTTKSNKNYYPDIEKITTEQIIGKTEITIYGLGFIAIILQSKIITGIIFVYLILKLLYDRYLGNQKQIRTIKKSSYNN